MITVKYEKVGDARFISHLDMQSIILRTIKRAGLEPNYSQGYNPHPILKMSKPLPLGIASLSEYFTLSIDNIDAGTFIELTKGLSPKGINFIHAWETDKNPNIFEAGYLTEYRIFFKNFDLSLLLKINKMIDEGFYVEKKERRVYVKQNVSSLICRVKLDNEGIVVVLASAENNNLRIIDFSKGLNEQFDLGIKVSNLLKIDQYTQNFEFSLDEYLNQI